MIKVVSSFNISPFSVAWWLGKHFLCLPIILFFFTIKIRIRPDVIQTTLCLVQLVIQCFHLIFDRLNFNKFLLVGVKQVLDLLLSLVVVKLFVSKKKWVAFQLFSQELWIVCITVKFKFLHYVKFILMGFKSLLKQFISSVFLGLRWVFVGNLVQV